MRKGNSLIVILIVLALLVGAVFWLSTKNASIAPSPAGTPTPAPTNVMSPTAVVTPSGTEGAMIKKEAKIAIRNFAFVPATITIKKGETVTWTNEDSVGHTATALDGTFDSGILQQGKSFSFTFTKAGTFDYKCTPHPNMRGKVVVE